MIGTVAETRALEGELIEDWGLPIGLLMERAALGVAAVTADIAGGKDVPIAVVVGPGHNGGDAAAAARLLQSWGFRTTIFASERPSDRTGKQLELASRFGVSCRRLDELQEATVVVDGLFGFGLNRPPEGQLAAGIRRVNELGARAVVAIDLPSGTMGDTGTAPGERVRATHTVATGLVKVGLACDPAVDSVGELWVADIGIPAPLARSRLTGEILQLQPSPTRVQSSHKGTFGTLLLVGGSKAMLGAPALAALAAGRVGCGLVIVATPKQHAGAIAQLFPEGLVVPLEGGGDGNVAGQDWHELEPWLSRATALAIGPGLGRGEEQRALVARAWCSWEGPLVIDADALGPDLLKARPKGEVVLTPHPGEAGRLLGKTSTAIQEARLAGAREIARETQGICVLKGARPLVARPNGRFSVLLKTTPALATAGSGDVLTGLIGGLLAQRMEPYDAACQAVARHAALGLHAAAQRGSGGVLARDLIDCLGFHGLSDVEAQLYSQDKVGSLAHRLC